MTAHTRWVKLMVPAALALGILFGVCSCSDDRVQVARAEGYKQGHKDGLREGTAIGARDTAIHYETEWGLRGLAVGFVVGAGVLALLTRQFIVSQWCKRRRRQQIGLLLRKCEVDLDDDLFERAMAIGLRKQKLEEELKRDKSVLISQLYSNVSYRLRQMDHGIVRLAALMQQLRTARSEVVVTEKATEKTIRGLRQALETSPNSREKEEIREAIAVETLRRQTVARNEANIRRCDLKLATLSSFLDNLIMTVANLRTVEEQDSFERFEEQVGQEVKDLEAFFERTLEQLFTVPNV